MLRYFPSCRRLSRLKDCPTGEDYGAADGDEDVPDDGAADEAEDEHFGVEEGGLRGRSISTCLRESTGRKDEGQNRMRIRAEPSQRAGGHVPEESGSH